MMEYLYHFFRWLKELDFGQSVAALFRHADRGAASYRGRVQISCAHIVRDCG
jgi:hypothetical protein